MGRPWRGVVREYADRLPSLAGAPVVTLHEGGTPLIHCENLSELTGAQVHVKYEGLNPTASFKDRGMTAAISVAKQHGARAVICASTGNTSASAAAYAVKAGMTCAVLVPDGPVTPVGVEQRVESLPEVSMAAVVGVGPAGTQQTVVVVVPTAETGGPLAPSELAATVRTVARIPVAAVLVTDRLPVDIRHASKIDRARVARWADHVLAGGSIAIRRRP